MERTSTVAAMTDPHHHHHHHAPVHLTEAEWASYAVQTELQGEVFNRFLTDTIEWIATFRSADAAPVRRVLDIGSGPGVSTCQLALSYPDADVTAVDASPAMLAAVMARTERLGLGERVHTALAELPDGLADFEDIDLIWASMSLHHIGDEVRALRTLRGLLRPSGITAIAELADPTRLLPDDLGFGRPGLAERVEAAGAAWFIDMRHGLADSVGAGDLSSKLTAAGFDVLGARIARDRLDAPLNNTARQVANGELFRIRTQLGDRLDADDTQTLDILLDDSDPRAAVHRPDLFIDSSRQIVLARPAGG